MIKTFIFILCSLLLTACAENQAMVKYNQDKAELDRYVELNKPRVKSGELLDSKFYSDIYDIYSRSNFSDKGYMMQGLVKAIKTSKEYEDGKITKDDFDLFLKQMGADIVANQQATEQRQREVEMQIRANEPPPPYLNRPQLNCRTYTVGYTQRTTCR